MIAKEIITFLIVAMTGILSIKSWSFWVYLWQLKEYRLDRFMAEYGHWRKLVRFWLFSGGRKFYQPVMTVKAGIILFSFLIFYIPCVQIFYGIIGAVVFYLLVPIFVSLVVFIFKLPTWVVKEIIYKRAADKIALMKNLTVVGIAGSYGKTSTKEFLAQILSQKFKVVKTPSNFNTEIGIAKFVLKNLSPETEIFIVEIGAYKIGEIKKICNVVKPKIGILTGIAEQHMALFGSLENIKKAKFELIESLPAGRHSLSQNGLAIFNGENKYCLELADKWQGKKIIYHKIDINKNIPEHYKINLGAVVTVAKHFGMVEDEIIKAIDKIVFTDKMINICVGQKKVLIIDDSYSANPEGVMAGLEYLAKQNKKIKIVVMPCLIELGEAAISVHERIAKKIKEICDLAIITMPDYFEYIKKEMGDKAILESNPDKIIAILKGKIGPETAILFEGRIAKFIIDSLKQ